MFINVISGKTWRVGSRRQIMDQFAQRKGFDPLMVDNWYNITELGFEHDHV